MTIDESVKAVEMVRGIRDEHYELLKDKTPTERRRYYKDQAKALHRKLGVREADRSPA